MRKTKGFTIAELLIVVGITLVLAAGGILMFTAIKKEQTSVKMDEIAKQIFIDAQNQMLTMKGSGEWSDLRETYEEEDYGTHITNKPTDYDYWLGKSGITEPSWSTAAPDMYYVSSADLGSLDLLNKLLPLGTIDNMVRSEGTYFIEYNRETAQVYGVFYTETDETIHYSDIIGFGSGIRENSEVSFGAARTERRSHKINNKYVTIGYYGGGITNELVLASLEDAESEFLNGEDLVLQVFDPNSNLYEPGLSKVNVTITGETSGETAAFSVSFEDGTVNLFNNDPAVLPIISGSAGSDGVTYWIVIDSITTDEYASSLTHNPAIGFLPGEDLTATVSAVSVTDLSVLNSVTCTANSIFGSVDAEIESTTINISQIRHLENLSGSVSGWSPVALGVNTNNFRIELTSNLSFDDAGENLSFRSAPSGAASYVRKDYTEKTIYYDPSFSSLSNIDVSAGFVPIVFPVSGSDFRFYGNDHIIYNLSSEIGGSDDARTIYAGIFSLLEFDCVLFHDTGVVGCPYGESSNAAIAVTGGYLNSSSVLTSNHVFAGVFAGQIQASEVYVQACYSTIRIVVDGYIGNCSVGGFFGSCFGSSYGVFLDKSYVSGHTVNGEYTETAMLSVLPTSAPGTVNIGSFVGDITDCDESEITALYSTADIRTTETWSYNIGGLIGYINGEITPAANYFAGQVFTGASSTVGAFFGVTDLPLQDECSIDCYYMRQIDSDVVSILDDNNGLVLTAKMSDDLSRFTLVTETLPYDETLSDFPYTDVTGLGHHYGDWTGIVLLTHEDYTVVRKTAYTDQSFNFDDNGIFDDLRDIDGLDPTTAITDMEILSSTTTTGSEIRVLAAPSEGEFPYVLHTGLNSTENDNDTVTFLKFTVGETETTKEWYIYASVTVEKRTPDIGLWNRTTAEPASSITYEFGDTVSNYAVAIEAGGVSYQMPSIVLSAGGTLSGLTHGAALPEYPLYALTDFVINSDVPGTGSLAVTAERNGKYETASASFTVTCTGKYFRISFNANGGSGTMTDMLVIGDIVNNTIRFNLPANTFMNTSADFFGWGLAPGQSDTYDYANSQSNIVANTFYSRTSALNPDEWPLDGETITLYALWSYKLSLTSKWGTAWKPGTSDYIATFTIGVGNITYKNPYNNYASYADYFEIEQRAQRGTDASFGSKTTATQEDMHQTQNGRYELTFTPKYANRWKDDGTQTPRTFVWGVYVCHDAYSGSWNSAHTEYTETITKKIGATTTNYITIQEAFDLCNGTLNDSKRGSCIILDANWGENPNYRAGRNGVPTVPAGYSDPRFMLGGKTLVGTLLVSSGKLYVGDADINGSGGTIECKQSSTPSRVIEDAFQEIFTDPLHDFNVTTNGKTTLTGSIAAVCVLGGECELDYGLNLVCTAASSVKYVQDFVTGIYVLGGACTTAPTPASGASMFKITVKGPNATGYVMPGCECCLSGVVVSTRDATPASFTLNNNNARIEVLDTAILFGEDSFTDFDKALYEYGYASDGYGTGVRATPPVRESTLIYCSGPNAECTINGGKGHAVNKSYYCELVTAFRGASTTVNGGTWYGAARDFATCLSAVNGYYILKDANNNPVYYYSNLTVTGGTIVGHATSEDAATSYGNKYSHNVKSAILQIGYGATASLTGGDCSIWSYGGAASGVIYDSSNVNNSQGHSPYPTVTIGSTWHGNVRGYLNDEPNNTDVTSCFDWEMTSKAEFPYNSGIASTINLPTNGSMTYHCDQSDGNTHIMQLKEATQLESQAGGGGSSVPLAKNTKLYYGQFGYRDIGGVRWYYATTLTGSNTGWIPYQEGSATLGHTLSTGDKNAVFTWLTYDNFRFNMSSGSSFTVNYYTGADGNGPIPDWTALRTINSQNFTKNAVNSLPDTISDKSWIEDQGAYW